MLKVNLVKNLLIFFLNRAWIAYKNYLTNCKLHVLYAFQPKGSKEEIIDKEDGVPEFIEKKIKASG